VHASGWDKLHEQGAEPDEEKGVADVGKRLPVLTTWKDSYKGPKAGNREQNESGRPDHTSCDRHSGEVAELLCWFHRLLDDVRLRHVYELPHEAGYVLQFCHLVPFACRKGTAHRTVAVMGVLAQLTLRWRIVTTTESSDNERSAATRARANIVPLITGQSVSLLGDYIAFFTLPYFMLSLTGRAVDLGLTAFAETLPMLLFGLAAGVFLDRMRRLGRALIIADIVRSLAFAFLAFVASPWGPDLTVTMTAGVILAVAFLVGSMSVLFDSGLQTYMTQSLLETDLIRAN
jgi:hypothetical protein